MRAQGLPWHASQMNAVECERRVRAARGRRRRKVGGGRARVLPSARPRRGRAGQGAPRPRQARGLAVERRQGRRREPRAGPLGPGRRATPRLVSPGPPSGQVELVEAGATARGRRAMEGWLEKRSREGWTPQYVRGDADRLKFGLPRCFFVVVTELQDVF